MHTSIDSQLGIVNIFRDDELNMIKKTSVCIGGKTLASGDKTSLNGFFNGEIEYLGLYDGYMQFVIGEFPNLLGTAIFTSSFKKITDTRIVTIYQVGTARDYHFKNGIWK